MNINEDLLRTTLESIFFGVIAFCVILLFPGIALTLTITTLNAFSGGVTFTAIAWLLGTVLAWLVAIGAWLAGMKGEFDTTAYRLASETTDKVMSGRY